MGGSTADGVPLPLPVSCLRRWPHDEQNSSSGSRAAPQREQYIKGLR
jgi:hypothetical protein